MDKHLAVCSTQKIPVFPLMILLVETSAKVLCHTLHSCVCGKRTVVSRTTVHSGASVCDMLCGWCLEGSVGFRLVILFVPILTFVASLIGFEELGNSDMFETAVLELRFSQSGKSPFLALYRLLIYLTIGVLQKAENSFNASYTIGHRGSARGDSRKAGENDEDFDLDD